MVENPEEDNDDDEDEDEDDDDVAYGVRSKRPKNWRKRLAVPKAAAAAAKDRSGGAEGGSSTPYHIIEILINSGGDNLPGVRIIL